MNCTRYIGFWGLRLHLELYHFFRFQKEGQAYHYPLNSHFEELPGVTDFTSRPEPAPDDASLSVLELLGKMPLIFSFIQSQADHSELADVQRIAIANRIMPSILMLPPAVNLSCDMYHHSLLLPYFPNAALMSRYNKGFMLKFLSV